jgi:hypothetical protein
MDKTVRGDGMETRVGKHDVQRAARGRIAL